MSMDWQRLAELRPGMPASELRAACGSDWAEPDRNAEGHMFRDDFSARITHDDKLGTISFYAKAPVRGAIERLRIGMTFKEFRTLNPDYVRISDAEREKYGWSIFQFSRQGPFNITAGIKDELIGLVTLDDPAAVYPERPYKYADPALTQAFDLSLGDPVDVSGPAGRPQHGWCFGLPPGLAVGDWPASPTTGAPLRHAFTLKLPPAYRIRGPERVAIALFVDEQFESLNAVPGLQEWSKRLKRDEAAIHDPAFGASATHFGAANPERFAMDDVIGGHFVAIWLTEAQFQLPVTFPPERAALPGTWSPRWLSQTPEAYFGEYTLPVTGAEQRGYDHAAPGGYGLSQLLAASAPKTGWRHLPALEALRFGWPIKVSPREGDPNIGKPAREWEHENQHSGYVPAYAEEADELGLETLRDRSAHLGGTMFCQQGYPDFSPYYLEFEEVFGGFNFGGGNAQLDLEQMLIDWACG